MSREMFNYCGFSHISAHHIGALHNDFNVCTVISLQKDLNSNIKEKLLHLLLFAFHIDEKVAVCAAWN